MRITLARSVVFPGLGCLAMALWMLWDSKVGKVRHRDKLLDQLTWRGDERVLDVGCGRGLMLIGAAKRLSSGHATGIDIWQTEDLSGNSPDATLANAVAEGVADRVEVRTADMRTLPFDDASFDVVVSNYAIHNLYQRADRAKAIAEIARVLHPDGRLLINDIRHFGEYASAISAAGWDVRRTGSRVASLFLAAVTFGSLRPATLVASPRRSAPAGG